MYYYDNEGKMIAWDIEIFPLQDRALIPSQTLHSPSCEALLNPSVRSDLASLPWAQAPISCAARQTGFCDMAQWLKWATHVS